MAKGITAGLAVGALLTVAGATLIHNVEGMGVMIGAVAGILSTLVGTLAGGIIAMMPTENWVPFDIISMHLTGEA